MLRGHAIAKADEKGRVKIPVEFSKTFLELCGPGRATYLTSYDGQVILVYPLPVWETREQKILSLPSTDPDLEIYLRALSYWGREAIVDSAGRILIHPLLRDSARINGAVSVFGRQHVLEIYDHEYYRTQPPVATPDIRARVSHQYGL